MDKVNYPLSHMPIAQAMQALGISKFFFYKLVNEGQLSIKKVGRKSFVAVAELNELFKSETSL